MMPQKTLADTFSQVVVPTSEPCFHPWPNIHQIKQKLQFFRKLNQHLRLEAVNKELNVLFSEDVRWFFFDNHAYDATLMAFIKKNNLKMAWDPKSFIGQDHK